MDRKMQKKRNKRATNKRLERIKEETTMDMNWETNIYEQCVQFCEAQDYGSALNKYNELICLNPGNVKLRNERDACKLILGQIVFPDLLEEPLDTTSMSYTQLIAFWKSQTTANDDNSKNLIEFAQSLKLTAHRQMLVHAFQHLYGWGVVKNGGKAFELFKAVCMRCSGFPNNEIEMEDAEAKYYIGLMYLYGVEVDKDERKGMNMLESVANAEPFSGIDPENKGRRAGVVEAQCALGIYHFHQAAIKKSSLGSFHMASLWFERAYRLGCILASSWMGYMYYSGIGLPKNEQIAEAILRDAADTSRCKQACIYLLHLYIDQMDTSNMMSVKRHALELNDSQITGVIQKMTQVCEARDAQRKAVEGLVVEFEEEYNLTSHGLCLRDRLRRLKYGPHWIRKADQVFKNCHRKFNVQVGIFNEIVDKSVSNDEIDVVGIIQPQFLENLVWKAATKDVVAQSMLDVLLRYSILLNLLSEFESNLSIFSETYEKATQLVNTLYFILNQEPTYMKWEPGYAVLLHQALKLIKSSSAKYKNENLYFNFIKRLDVGLAIIGIIVDSHDEENFKCLANSWMLHDNEYMVTKALAEYYYKIQDFDRAYIVLEEGLEREPNYLSFLYLQGMVCLKNKSELLMNTLDMKIKGIVQLEQFLEGTASAKNNPKIPEAYYMLSKAYYELYKHYGKPANQCVEVMMHFFDMGKVAEHSQLLCFTPYLSHYRNLLEVIIKQEEQSLPGILEMVGLHVEVKLVDHSCIDQLENIVTNCAQQVGDPALDSENPEKEIKMEKEAMSCSSATMSMRDIRKKLILELRNEFKKSIAKNAQKKRIFLKFNKSLTEWNKPSLDDLAQFKPILVNELEIDSDTGERAYPNRILCLTVIDEPFFGLGSEAILLVAEDGTKAAIQVQIYRLSQDETVQENLGFGCKFIIVHPLIKGEGRVVKVVDPHCLVFDGKVESMCRYCLKTEATKICSKCKWAKYCNRECQENDWKIMKHKWICHVDPYWNKSLCQKQDSGSGKIHEVQIL